MLFTIPGIPSIYYGSEWGIEGDRSITDLNLRPELSIDDFYNNNFEYNCSEDMLETLKNATTRKHTTGFYLDETVDYD